MGEEQGNGARGPHQSLTAWLLHGWPALGTNAFLLRDSTFKQVMKTRFRPAKNRSPSGGSQVSTGHLQRDRDRPWLVRARHHADAQGTADVLGEASRAQPATERAGLRALSETPLTSGPRS